MVTLEPHIDHNKYYVKTPTKYIGIQWNGAADTGQKILKSLGMDAKIEFTPDGVLELRVKDKGFDSLDWVAVPLGAWLVISGYDYNRLKTLYEIMSEERFRKEFQELV